MKTKKLSDIAKLMRDIDIAMLSTHTTGGNIAGRPMSNNREVEYDGDSYYFTWEKSRTVSDIEKEPRVSLAFQGKKGLHIAVEGKATVIRDKKQFEKHWNDEINHWFRDGVDTPGVAMIRVRATRLRYWNGEEDEGELKL